MAPTDKCGERGGIGNAETDKCAGDTESGNGNTPDERG